jgi:hypothetical protein
VERLRFGRLENGEEKFVHESIRRLRLPERASFLAKWQPFDRQKRDDRVTNRS